jgi:hypothetical protein
MLKNILLVILFATTNVAAQERLTFGQAEEIFRLSGLQRDEDVIRTGLEKSLLKKQDEMEGDLYNEMQAMFTKSFNRDSIHRDIIEKLQSEFDVVHFAVTKEKLQNKNIQKINLSLAKLQNMFHETAPKMSQDRKKLFERLVDATNPEDLGMVAARSMFSSMAEEAEKQDTTSSEETEDAKELLEGMGGMMDILAKAKKKQFVDKYSFFLQSFTDNDIQEYVVFWESKEGQNLNTAMKNSTTYAAQNSMKKMTKLIIQKALEREKN